MLKNKICGVEFKNPVIAASGTFGFGREYAELFDLSRLGGICSKGITPERRDGNEGARIYETASGMINSIGLQNPGIEGFLKDELPFFETLDTVKIVNLGGSTIEEMQACAEKLSQTKIDLIELNISCPNVKEGGMAFGIKSETAAEVTKKVKECAKKPLVVKLSPNAHDIAEMASLVEEAGADALSLVNTFKAMAIDLKTRKPVFKNVFAGLSGPAIKPIALRMVYEVSERVSIPIIGIGGILSAADALEFLFAGASLIQVGTGNFIKPDLMLDIIEGMEEYVQQSGAQSVTELIGAARK